MNKYFIYFLLSLSLISCGRDEPLKCDSNLVTTLDVLNSDKSPKFYSQNITDTKVTQTTNNKLSCSANLNLISNLDNTKIVLPVTYTVSRGDSKSSPITSSLSLQSTDQSILNKWLQSQAELTKSLGDYQLSPGGALFVIKESIEESLYFNGKPIVPEIHNQIVSIEKSYTLGTMSVFLVGSYTGGEIDADTPNNYLIEIDKSGTYKISTEFSYQVGGIIASNESLVINGVIQFRQYAESNDYPIYSYSNGELNTIRPIKPESYYVQKFSGLSSDDIVNIAKADQCFDNDNNQIDMTHKCAYGNKYCFMYKAINESQPNRNSLMLKNICESN